MQDWSNDDGVLGIDRILNYTKDNEAFLVLSRTCEIPGCFSAGNRYKKTLDNVKEALEMQLEFYFERDSKFRQQKLLKDFADDMKDYYPPSPEWQQVTMLVDTEEIEKDLTRENDVNFQDKGNSNKLESNKQKMVTAIKRKP